MVATISAQNGQISLLLPAVMRIQTFLIFACCLLTVDSAVAQPEPSPPTTLVDAELTAVTFVDADRGWAVGDRGVIWHTSDGGREWKLQNSGITCRLEAVQFLDADNGFAVGGWTQPYTHATHGVALRTRDGGKTWQNSPDLTLPGLKHVRFFDARQGLALGDGSPLYPAGVFRSDDGGRTWSPLPKGESPGWAAGDFRDSKSGALAGLDGTLAVATRDDVRPSRKPAVGARFPRRLWLNGHAGGWLVGDGGLVLTTGDSGVTWTLPVGPLPGETMRNLDCRALAVHGSNVWIAGAPGSCVIHSADEGRTWQSFHTGHHAPLWGLWFIDDYRGWAVGALGNILHTRDGGRTWRSQRTGGTRAALLCIFSQPERVPLELLAEQAGNGAFLTAVEIVGREEQHVGLRNEALTLPRRTHAAVVAAGGSVADTAWSFPLPDMGLLPSGETIVGRWNAEYDGQALERLEEHLVRRIRQWRPDVIVTEDVSPHGDDPLAHLTNQLTLAAATKAADEAAYPEQIRNAGQAAWRVKKVFAVLPDGKQGVVNVSPAQWGDRLGRSLAEQSESGRGLLDSDVTASPQNIGLSLLVDRLPQNSGKRDVMSGIGLTPGGDARRQLADPPAGNLQAMADVARKRHNVEQLLTRIDSVSSVGSGWLGQVGDLTAGLPANAAGNVLWQLGRRYQGSGKFTEAAEALTLLVDKYPRHSLADAAAQWLVQYYASGEVAWRVRQDARPEARAGQALRIAKLVEQTRPTLHANPELRFALAAAYRQTGQARMVERLFHNLHSATSTNVWAQCAAAEQWILRPNDNPPKEVCAAVAVRQKPRLDGRLDDPVWQSAKPVSLHSADVSDGKSPAAAVLAHDEEYLYLAVSCPKAAGLNYTISPADQSSTRVPDTDLAERDRVIILIDIDRDYATHWRLTIDHRGWPAESCFGDATWNPQWFIAAGGDEQFWTVEAAIPLAELAPAKPQVRDAWAIGFQRIIPHVAVQSFTAPAAVKARTEAMGLLVFE